MELKDISGSSGQPSPVANRDNKKRERKIEDEEEAAFILDDLQSGERVLYLQGVPRVKSSHCRAESIMYYHVTHLEHWRTLPANNRLKCSVV